MKKNELNQDHEKKPRAAGFWNFYARIYDLLATFSPYVRMQEKVIKNLRLINDVTIVDVCCGTGNTLKRLVSCRKILGGLKIVGLDFSAAMLGRARRKLAGISQLRLWPGNFNEIPAPNIAPDKDEAISLDDVSRFGKKYDRLVAVNGLYVSSNPKETLQHWYEILEDGGIAVIVNPFKPKLGPIWKEFFQNIWRDKSLKDLGIFIVLFPVWILMIILNLYIARKSRKQIYYFLQPDVLKTMAEEAGFKILSQELVYGDASVLFSLQKDAGAAIRRAQTPDEIELVYRLRYNVFCEEMKSVAPELFPDGREVDKFDFSAIHFIARRNKVIIGSVRMIPDSGNGFLLEEHFKLLSELDNEDSRAKTMELSRVILSQGNRGGQLSVDLGVQALLYGLNHGYSFFIAASTEMLWNMLKRNRCRIVIWDNYIEYHNTISAPALMGLPSKYHE